MTRLSLVPMKVRAFGKAFVSAMLVFIMTISLAGCSESPEALAEKRQKTLEYTDRIHINYSDISAIKSDGTVETSGFDDDIAGEISSWTDIVQVVSPTNNDLVGLKSDGTVVSAGKGSDTYFDLSGWTEVIQITSCRFGVYGLRSDGTVYAASEDEDINGSWLEVDDWKNVVSLYQCSYVQAMYALTEDGRILTTSRECAPIVSNWTDVVNFSYGRGYGLALRSDGTVYSLEYPDEIAQEISEWEGIVDVVAAGEYGLAAGLKEDGTVVFTGTKEEDGSYEEESFSEIESWRNVIDIAGANSYLVGLTSDGHVLFAGRNGATKNSAYDTSGYRDCVAIYAADPSFVALKSDGTLEGYVNVAISGFSPLW